MSAPTATPPQPPVFIAPSAGPRRSTGRRVAIVLGALAALFGAVLAIAGGALFAVGGSDGEISSGRHAVTTPTRALVSGTASIEDTTDIGDVVGSPRIAVDARAAGGRPVFVGVGRSADVERYLAGAAVDEVTDLDLGPFRLDRDRRTGTEAPGAPGEQSFWVDRDTGERGASIDWKVRDGDYRVVVMNADASADVRTDTRFGVTVPFLPGVAAGLLVAGLLIVGGGVLAIVLGARRPR